MYINIGTDKTVLKKDVVGIFDIDTTTVKKDSRLFLKKAEEKKEVTTLSLEDMPLSFIIFNKSTKTAGYKVKNNFKTQEIFISPNTVATLNLRWQDKKR